jgi:hypothetical protein
MTQFQAMAAMGAGLLLWAGATSAQDPAAGKSPAKLRADFAQPPRPTRLLKIIHGWPDQPEQQDQRIAKLLEQGFAGVVCNVAFDGGYVESEAKWTSFLCGVKAAKAAGMSMWLYDEKGYPSGNAGGIVLRDHPEWEARGLLIADQETSGTNVVLEVPPGKVVLAAAFPVGPAGINLAGKKDLSAQVRESRLEWQPPAGRWRVMVFTDSNLYKGTHADHNLHEHMPYPNLMLRAPTTRFLEVTHAQYARRLDNDLGKWFMATFTDEPSLMSLFLSPMPYRVVPWSPEFAAVFQKRRGYDLTPLLPALAANAGPQTAKARHDFWLTVGELVSENYFGQIQEWCTAHHIPSGGHLLFEEAPLYQVASYGDFFRCIRRTDAPSIDCLTSIPGEVNWCMARLLASVGELNDWRLVMSEASDHSQRYRPEGDQRPKVTVTEDQIRGSLNRQMVAGVNCFTTYYSYAGLTDDQLGRINEYIGRCCLMLREPMTRAARIALVYPTESLWPRFVPSHHVTREATAAQPIADAYAHTAELLYAQARDFTIVDAQALMKAKPGPLGLTHGALQWQAVILPRVDTLPLAAWENLAAFVRQGGLVIALGVLPANSERNFPDAAVQRLAREIFGDATLEPGVKASARGGAGVFLPPGTDGLLARLLDQALPPEVRVGGAGSPLRVAVRQSASQYQTYLINDSARPWQGTVSMTGAAGEIWDPETGRIEAMANPSAITLSLEPYGSAFVRQPAKAAPPRRRLESGSLPGLTMTALPAVAASVVGGEFVTRELQKQATKELGTNAWRAIGTLTKTGVDTHLFTLLPFPQGAPLQNTEFVVLDTAVPAGQQTPSQILVILHEKGGGDYLASSGQFLNDAGFHRAFIPISRFKLAGWSKDANGKFDDTEVTEVRVGWGGYFGTQGEKVEFSFGMPKVIKKAGEISAQWAKPKF